MLFRSNTAMFGFLDEREFYGEIPMRPTGREVGWVEVEDIPSDATLGLGRMWKGRRSSDFEEETGFLSLDDGDPLAEFYAEIDARIAREDGFGSEFGDPYSDRLIEFLCGLDQTGEMDAVELLEMALVAASDRRKVKTADARSSRAKETHHAKRSRFKRIQLISAAA